MLELAYVGARPLPPIAGPVLGGMILVSSVIGLVKANRARNSGLVGPGRRIILVFLGVVGLGLIAIGIAEMTLHNCAPLEAC